jgi:hypothetical protein
VTLLNFVCKGRAPLLRAACLRRSRWARDVNYFFACARPGKSLRLRRNADEMRLFALSTF